MNQKFIVFKNFFFSVGFGSCNLEACKTNNFGTIKFLKKVVKEKSQKKMLKTVQNQKHSFAKCYLVFFVQQNTFY